KGSFTLLAIDADPKIRYERISSRGSSTDNVSFEKFLTDEQREMESTDPNKQNLSECIKRADFVIDNNGSMEKLNEEIEKILQIITNK
ncbi:MAG: hypothetical protein PHH12_01305, partial [Candidatus Shapirobacteria bacterium]|nr:hypothetical protein [Candidatus Shapirobacteria bacterium]